MTGPVPSCSTRPVCPWCSGPLPAGRRRDAIYCSKRCRQAAHRFQRGLVARARAALPIRAAYADPPYPEKSWLYRGHPDYAGEVDHRALVARLVDGYPDGWALSTSAEALPAVLALCPEGVKVAAWFRGERSAASSWPLPAWEPVIYFGGRPQLRPAADRRVDALVYVSRPRLTDPGRVIGAKPAEFSWWLFELLGLLPGDQLDDLFPGSGGIARAWDLYASPGDGDDVSGLQAVDGSPLDRADASPVDAGDRSSPDPADVSRRAAADPSPRGQDDPSPLPAPDGSAVTDLMAELERSVAAAKAARAAYRSLPDPADASPEYCGDPSALTTADGS